jgi:hypothetical protein
MGFVDKDGRGIRYRTMYSNEIYGLKEAPTPSYGGGGGAPGQGQGGGGRRGGGAGNAPQQP